MARRVVLTHGNEAEHRRLLADAINRLATAVESLSKSATSWDISVTAVTGAAVGTLLAIVTSGYALATNATAGYAARVVVSAISGTTMTVQLGGRLYMPSHGKGSAGNELWLETAGDVTKTEPSGVATWQRVGFVEDPNHIVFTVETPRFE